MLTFMGLILRENDRGETSKSITVLTAERGVIDIFVRGGRKSTKNASSTQLFAYSKLCVEEKRNAKDQSMFFLNSSESEKLFYNIRLDNELLKSIFELRLLCEAGLRPALLGCSVCMAYEADIMHFNLSTGVLECDKCCYNPDSIYDIELDRTMLYIVRFIALTEYERLFAFKISERYQKKLTAFTERFVRYNLKGKFPSLDFYRLL